MKKSFPYFRCVDHTSDGCSEYQCLACKATWEARRCAFVYCGACGIKFAGEHKSVTRSDKEWSRETPRTPPKSRFVIEAKRIDRDRKLQGAWLVIYDGYGCDTKRIAQMLKDYRANDEWSNYRIALECPGFNSGRSDFRARMMTGSCELCYGLIDYPKSPEDLARAKQYWHEDRANGSV